MSKNLQSSLRRKRRSGNPMSAYDTLPAPLRHWVAQAALPWSPTSAQRIWRKCKARGLSDDAALSALTLAETRTLARDRLTL